MKQNRGRNDGVSARSGKSLRSRSNVSMEATTHGCESASIVTVRAEVDCHGFGGPMVRRIHRTAGFGAVECTHHTFLVHTGDPTPIAYHCGDACQTAAFGSDDVLFSAGGSVVRYVHDRAVEVLVVAIGAERVTSVGRDLSVVAESIQVRDMVRCHDARVRVMADNVLTEVRDERAGSLLYGEAVGTQLAIHLIRRYTADTLRIDNAHHDRRKRLSNAIRYINDNIGRPIRVSELAAQAHLSSSHFSHMFTRSYGVSPYQYVLRRRLECARLMLANGVAVSDTAERVGFADHGHFIRHYRRLFGVNPRFDLRAPCEATFDASVEP